MCFLLSWYPLGCIGDVSKILRLQGEGRWSQEEFSKSLVQPHGAVEQEENPQEGVLNYFHYTPNGDNKYAFFFNI
jgi:hypothetical protein